MEDKEGRVMRSKREILIEEFPPYILSIFSTTCFAVYNIVSKVSLDKGMSLYVLVAYGHAFGTLTTAILAFLFERKNKSKISVPILRNVFFLGLIGAVFARTLYYMGLKDTSGTFASAMCNIIPSITFILAVLFRMEKLDIYKLGAQAKVVGTVITFTGAILLTLYKGIVVIPAHTKHSSGSDSGAASFGTIDKEWIKGSLVLIVSYFSFSAMYILQTTTVKLYPAPITLTALTCLSGTFLSTIMTAIMDHKAASWKLSRNITLLAPLYSGIVIFGITGYVQTLVIRRKGPVFVTAFRPLATVIVAILELFIGEALQLGTILGATLICLGLYAILWGKAKERENRDVEKSIEHVETEDISIIHDK